MTIHMAIVSADRRLLDEVHGFAQGLGCTFDAEPVLEEVAFNVPGGADMLLNVLTFAALSATRLGLDPSEPLCHVRYHEGHAATEVTLTIRLAGFTVGTAPPAERDVAR